MVVSDWNLNRRHKSRSTFKTTKYIALGYTNPYNHTYTQSFSFENELCNSNREKMQIKDYIRILQKLYLGSKVNNYNPWAKSSYVFIKFYWSTATPLHLRIIYTSFHVPIAELSSRARPLYGAQSLKSLLSGPLQKSSLTLYRSKNVSIMIWMSWSNRRSSSPVFLNQKSTLKYFHIIFGYSTILLRICVAKTS